MNNFADDENLTDWLRNRHDEHTEASPVLVATGPVTKWTEADLDLDSFTPPF